MALSPKSAAYNHPHHYHQAVNPTSLEAATAAAAPDILPRDRLAVALESGTVVIYEYTGALGGFGGGNDNSNVAPGRGGGNDNNKNNNNNNRGMPWGLPNNRRKQHAAIPTAPHSQQGQWAAVARWNACTGGPLRAIAWHPDAPHILATAADRPQRAVKVWHVGKMRLAAAIAASAAANANAAAAAAAAVRTGLSGRWGPSSSPPKHCCWWWWWWWWWWWEWERCAEPAAAPGERVHVRGPQGRAAAAEPPLYTLFGGQRHAPAVAAEPPAGGDGRGARAPTQRPTQRDHRTKHQQRFIVVVFFFVVVVLLVLSLLAGRGHWRQRWWRTVRGGGRFLVAPRQRTSLDEAPAAAAHAAAAGGADETAGAGAASAGWFRGWHGHRGRREVGSWGGARGIALGGGGGGGGGGVRRWRATGSWGSTNCRWTRRTSSSSLWSASSAARA